jgi:hypothetical protein
MGPTTGKILVIPAEAGSILLAANTQKIKMDPRFRGDDEDKWTSAGTP